MSFDELLQAKRLRPHEPTAEEIGDLFDRAMRDLQHARQTTDSQDWRFIAAYSAARAIATVPLAASGFRASGPGHHATVIAALPASLGPDALGLKAYLNQCRALRNRALYDEAHLVTAERVEELLEAVADLRRLVLTWLAENHPDLLPET